MNLDYRGTVVVQNQFTNGYLSVKSDGMTGDSVVQYFDSNDIKTHWELFWDPSATKKQESWEGLYFRAKVGNFYLNVKGGQSAPSDGAIQVWTFDGSCRWRITSQPSEHSSNPKIGRIQSMDTWRVLNVKGGTSKDEEQIIQYDDNGDLNNTWVMSYLT